ncbi:hypothetical protein ABQF34_01940 [Mycolicibacterium boenickei]
MFIGEVRLFSYLLRRVAGVCFFLLSLLDEIVDFLKLELNIVSNSLFSHPGCPPRCVAPIHCVGELLFDLLHRLAVLFGFRGRGRRAAADPNEKPVEDARMRRLPVPASLGHRRFDTTQRFFSLIEN